MHVRELVELAALLSGHADVLVGNGTQLTRDGMSEYWSAAKARMDRWSRSLFSLSLTPKSASSAEFEFVPAVVEPLLHEIFASEVLTRVWAAVVGLFDASTDQCAATAVARSVLIGHQDVRCRALHWLLNGPLAHSPHADAVNLIRRRCERWTDLLIANCYHLGDVSEFSVDAVRAGDFAHDFAQQRRSGTYPVAWSVTMTSLRSALQVGIARDAFSRDANRRISGAVLACLGPDLFTATGSLRTAWLMRLQSVTDDTEGMLSDLLALEAPVGPWESRFSL
jgi:hypothetical protein